MKEHRIRSALAGIIIGFLLGSFYYIVFAKFLVCGPMKITLMLPQEVYIPILLSSLMWGGGSGAAIGLILGLATSIVLPRGHMATSISVVAFIVCTIIVFVINGHYMLQTPFWSNVMTIFFGIILLLFAAPIGRFFGFIEKMRE